MIDKLNPPKYLRQISTERIYPYAANIADRPDMEAYDGEVEKSKATNEVAATNEEIAALQALNVSLLETIESLQAELAELKSKSEEASEERLAKIKEAISRIPVEVYGKPYAGKPAMPKVSDVSEAAGFKVTVEEVAAAMDIQ